jgi:Putative adhesin
MQPPVTFPLYPGSKSKSHTMKNRILLVAALFLAVLSLPKTASAQSEKTKTFKGIKSVRLSTGSGDCKIQRSADATTTSVFIKTTGDYDKTVEVTMDPEGDKLVIRENHLQGNTHGSATWTLTVPDGVDIRFKTGSGTLSASNLKVNLDATTGSGDFEFSKITGTVNATSGSGDLLLEDSNGEIKVTVGSGSATVKNSQGDMRVTCGSGNIKINDSQATFVMTTGSGNVSSQNLTVKGASKFTSGSGHTVVSLAATPGADITVSSGSGDAELNFNGHEIVGEIVMKASKEHGKIIAPFNFDKTEEIGSGGDNITVKKTAVKGNASPRINVSTGSGDAILSK